MDTTLPTQIDLEVVTPDRRTLSANVTRVTLPGLTGELGILPGHAPLVSELSPGVLSYAADSAEGFLAIGSGFAEVLPGRVIVLVGSAESAEDIDLAAVRDDQKRAEELLKKPVSTESALQEAETARGELKLALARIDVATRASRPRG